MQHDQTTTEDKVVTYARNHGTTLSVLRGPQALKADQGEEPGLTMSLERVLVCNKRCELVPFEGPAGIEALLEQLAILCPSLARIEIEDHLMGLEGTIGLNDACTIGLEVSLGAGGQIICTAGPTSSVANALAAIEAFDRQVHVASLALDCDFELLGEGYDPLVSSPLDVPLVPRTKWTLLTAHLSQTGRYSRDVMRCGCATTVTVEHNGDRSAIVAYRLATALSPIISFLTDNVRSFRGAGARRSPRMVRSIMWDEVDPTRCGVVPETFANDFSLDTYLTWLESTQPILFTDSEGATTSTGKSTTRELMESRLITSEEAAGLLHSVYPSARLLEGTIELPKADALRPRMAAGYLAFIKGLFCTGLAVDSALSLFGGIAEKDVALAAEALRRQGWDAMVYGQRIGTLVDNLLQVSRANLSDAYERQVVDNIAELWEVHMVPRDAFVHQEIKASRGW